MSEIYTENVSIFVKYNDMYDDNATLENIIEGNVNELTLQIISFLSFGQGQAAFFREWFIMNSKLKNADTDFLFDCVLSLKTHEECYDFFEDLCTVKEISDMAQRLQAAKLLLDGATYEQIVKAVEISTATISRINRCIQYGSGGYRDTIEKVRAQAEKQ